ncbi:MAG: HAD-IG family 5'-nucleotidase [Deltaproteobacteria bacterium]|nr:HAD-IG family 5'-nucleotidase [Deltaproteobacteria bacterium]
MRPTPSLADLARLLTQRELSQPELRPGRQVYTNRSLKLDKIQIVGFDMDYTLAVYSMRHIEELAFVMTLQRLVERRGYPQALLSIQYDHEFVIRGLVVDKDHGNLFKMDRHNFVGRCYHGRKALTVDERRVLYQNEKVRIALPRFAWIDTLFSLPEACLYAEIIDRLEVHAEGEPKPKVDYHKLYDDIRETIDEVHRDGSLKTELKKDLAKFIVKDPELGPTLHKLRSGGKKLFILTNSLWDYTEAVMSYLLDGLVPEYPSWRNYFDLVLVGAQKPGFFTEQKPFIELDADGGVASAQVKELERGKVYEGGNLFDFERLSGFAGASVLYVGDHIYGDIIRNRKSSLWRTCFIVQELEREVDYMEAHARELDRLGELEVTRNQLDDLINHHKMLLNGLERGLAKAPTPELEQKRAQAKGDLEGLRGALRAVTAEGDELEERFEKGANRSWGLVFKEGHENSRFGEQVEDYADLYTSRVSNLLYYSPSQYFRSPRQTMPHERRGRR